MESNSIHMPVVNQQIVENIVKQLKSQGIFDQFRRDCLADVDTKPSYQNLRQRVEGYVSKFLSQQSWNPSMNKNQLRDELRRQINESGMLSIGVEHVADQIVNSKANRIFLPQIEIAARRYLGLDKSEPISEESEAIGNKDDKEDERWKSLENSVEKGRSSPLIKEVPSQLYTEEKPHETASNNKDEENVTEEISTIKNHNDYSILNTSRETETTASEDDELLPPGVDLEPSHKPSVDNAIKEQLLPDVSEFSQCDDTSSSFNSEPLVIYDPQESQENSRDITTASNSPKDEKMDIDNQTSSEKNAQVIEDPVKESIIEDLKIETKVEVKETSPGIVEKTDEVKPKVEEVATEETNDDKKSLESEIKKLLQLSDKEKLEQEIRRILEIESKKMVEIELKKRESMEIMKSNQNQPSDETRTLSTDSMSRSNSSSDLTKEKTEKMSSSKSDKKSSDSLLSRSNSSSELPPKDKHSSSKSSKSKQESGSSKSSKDSKDSKSQSSDKNKRDHRTSTSSSSKSSSSKYKSDKKDSKESKSSTEKSKYSSSSSSGKSKSSSSYTLAKPIPKSSNSEKDKAKSKTSSSSSKSGGDSASKNSKLDHLFQSSKDKSSSKISSSKTNSQKSTSSKSSTKEYEKDISPKKSSKESSKTEKNEDSHIFKSPDINSVDKKPPELESSETDDDFIRALNNSKRSEETKEEDKKSDVSVSSVHTSDLSSFDDEISLSSSDEMKAVPIPSPVKEVKKIPLKDIKEITAIIKEKSSSGRNTPIPEEEDEDERKKKKQKVSRNDPLPVIDESNSSQKEDLTSETQTSDDDKGRTGFRSGLRRQRKINPKYASDEYSSIFNKTRKERKSTDETKPSESRKRPYSRIVERKQSKGPDSEGETAPKSAKTESNRGSRGRNSRS